VVVEIEFCEAPPYYSGLTNYFSCFLTSNFDFKPSRCGVLLNKSRYTMILFALLFASIASCNVEKTVFLAPLPQTYQKASRSLCLHSLHHPDLATSADSWRTTIPVKFPTPDRPRGTSSWVVLDGLTPAQRYEARVCWAAIVSLCLVTICLDA
jgi:hypothetical protein